MRDVPSKVTWRAVLAYVSHSGREDAVIRRDLPLAAKWTASEYLLAAIVDLTTILAWQNTKDGKKNRKRPKPIARPGDAPAEKTLGATKDQGMDLAEAARWLAERRINPPKMKLESRIK